jgi:hypothetical protein
LVVGQDQIDLTELDDDEDDDNALLVIGVVIVCVGVLLVVTAIYLRFKMTLTNAIHNKYFIQSNYCYSPHSPPNGNSQNGLYIAE